MAFTYTYTGTEDQIVDIWFKERARIVKFKKSGTFEVSYRNQKVFQFILHANRGDFVLIAVNKGEIAWIKYN